MLKDPSQSDLIDRSAAKPLSNSLEFFAQAVRSLGFISE